MHHGKPSFADRRRPKNARFGGQKPQPLRVLYEDSDLIAVEKPAHLATVPGRGEQDDLLHRLADQIGIPASGSADPRLRIVHRLDKQTSGVILLAKTGAMHRHLSMQFQQNRVQKEYLAIVLGKPRESEGIIDGDIAPHPSAKDKMAVVRQGKPALTHWRMERKLGPFSLIRCFPKTGRTHQIRVHLFSIGLPLAVDPLYHRPAAGEEEGLMLSHWKRNYRPNAQETERPLIARMTLHAEKLMFTKPDGSTQTIECEPPKDFRATVNQLGRL